eukprot:jgi/Picre1/32665/NNA_008011.t1
MGVPCHALRQQQRAIGKEMHTTISGVEEVFGQKTSRGTQTSSSRDPLASTATTREFQQHCYGCGVAFRLTIQRALDMSIERNLRRRHDIGSWIILLCVRCQDLSHGKMIPGVEDFAQLVEPRGLQKRLATPQELREELQSVRSSRALIVLLVDLLDFSGSLLSRVRDLVGKNPIIAVGTKMDLLPRHVDCGDAFFDWFEDSLAFKKLSVVSMHVVSSKTGEGIDEVAADIKQERWGEMCTLLVLPMLASRHLSERLLKKWRL